MERSYKSDAALVARALQVPRVQRELQTMQQFGAKQRRQRLDRNEVADIPVVMITHDAEDLYWFGEQVLYLRDGSIAERPTTQPQPSTASLDAA